MSTKLVMETTNQPTLPKGSKDSVFGQVQEQIQKRAYELYEARGRVDGHHEEDWARAETEILAQNEPRRAA